MSRFDEDTSTMRLTIAPTPIELGEPEDETRPRTPGIITGALLGAIMWAAIIALGLAVCKWISQ